MAFDDAGDVRSNSFAGQEKDMSDFDRLIVAIRTSGRLRDQDHVIVARALRLILERRGDFDADPTESLVQAVASLSVMAQP